MKKIRKFKTSEEYQEYRREYIRKILAEKPHLKYVDIFRFNAKKHSLESIMEVLGSKVIRLDLYKKACWCFDDESKGIYAEPFVRGMSEMLDEVARHCGRTDTMSIELGEYLDSWDYKLELVKEEDRGAVYYCPDLDMTGWLCPVLHQYFDEVPQTIYIRVLDE